MPISISLHDAPNRPRSPTIRLLYSAQSCLSRHRLCRYLFARRRGPARFQPVVAELDSTEARTVGLVINTVYAQQLFAETSREAFVQAGTGPHRSENLLHRDWEQSVLFAEALPNNVPITPRFRSRSVSFFSLRPDIIDKRSQLSTSCILLDSSLLDHHL